MHRAFPSAWVLALALLVGCGASYQSPALCQTQQTVSGEIQVAGRVRSPGIYPFTAGTTLAAAVAQAGGTDRAGGELLQARVTRTCIRGGRAQFILDIERDADVPLAAADLVIVLIDPASIY